MDQKFNHKIVSVVLALLVLLSTASIAMEKHFCGDVLIDVAIFSHPDSCGMEMSTAALNSDKKSCCKDVVEIVKGQDQLKKGSFEDYSLDQHVFVTALIYSYSHLFEDLTPQAIRHQDYSPPHLIADIHVRNQVFII